MNFRMITNICADDLQASKKFYVELLGLEVVYESDWYIQFNPPGDKHLEFAVIRRDHELIPADARNHPTGMYMTFVVADVDAVYGRATALGLPIVQQPKNEFYGQRRFLTRDPDGCLIDISSPVNTANNP